MPSIRLVRVGFAYDGREAVLRDVDLHIGAGWTGVVGANGAGKTTLLRLALGELAPTTGLVQLDPRDALARMCEQRVDRPGSDVLALRDERWLGRLALDPEMLAHWPTLSAGERKRWQIAAALAAEPAVLLLDEPTNHLDGEARAMVIAALRRLRGVGLVVSHDRELLDALTGATVRVDRGGAALYGGPYSAAREQWEAEAEARREALAAADAERRRIARQLDAARRSAASAERQKRPGARMRFAGDSDARSIRANMRAERAAGSHAQVVSRTRQALAAASERARALAVDRERGRDLMVGWEPPRRRFLAALDGVTLRAGDHVVAREVRVALGREDRVHVAGRNGAGKSTLLAALVSACGLPPDRILWLPQELAAGDGAELVRSVAELPPDQRGRVGQLAAALGLDPSRALASGLPSPGEARKLAIALGLARRVWLVALDEPTNHLDLPSIERLEQALAAYPGALLLASHDRALAARLTTATWRVEGGAVTAG